MDNELEARPLGAVRLRKVKGHATWEQVCAGQVKEVDKLGNDAADCLHVAVAGAALHGVPAEEAAQAEWRAQTTHQVQCMMVDILMARQAANRERRPAASSEDESEAEETSSSESNGDSSGSTGTTSHRSTCAAEMPPD